MKKNKLTIGYLLDDTLDRADGVQQAVITIAEKMRSLGHDVHYIVAETERTDLDNIHSIGKILSIKFNGNSVRTPISAPDNKIVNLFNDIKFDVLHVQMPYSPFFAKKVLNKAPANIKKFGTFHILPYGVLSSYGTKALGKVLKQSINSLEQVFAVSRPANKFMYESFGVSGEIIPNPVDYKFYNSFKKTKHSKKQIVFVGRFEKRKGVLELVEAYSGLENNIRNKTSLIMCGKGPLLEEAKNMSLEKKLDIKFPGFVSEEEKAQYLADADIAVFPSISGESFGIVLTEAMSAGAGITIGGNNPGYSSVLGDWPETLFDPTNIKEFTKILSKFILNKNPNGVKQHINVRKYDVDIVVKKLLEYYVD